MSVAVLIREIIRNNPPLTHLILDRFSGFKKYNESSGEIILDALLNSSISSI